MTLRTRTLVMVTLLLVGAVLAVGAIMTWSARQTILTQQEQDGLLVARLLARTISTVEEFPQELEDAISEQMVTAGDFAGIHVVDSATTTLVFSGAPGIDLIELTGRDIEELKLVLESGEESVHLEGGLLKVIVPIKGSGDNEAVIGAVVVYMPTDLLQAVMRQQIWRAALAAMFVLAVGVVVSTVLSRRVTGPVSAIAHAASTVQTGEYTSVDLSKVLARRDELGNLGRVFDLMAREVMAREQRMQMLRKVIPIGVSLSAEKDFNRLLETIVIEAQNITNADGGTLYLLEGKQLRFFILRNTSLNLAIGGTTGEPISFAPLELYEESGQPNHHHVATHVALSCQRINIADAYETGEFDFSGTKSFDATTGYRSKSFLTIPIEGEENEVIGVLQLINSLEPETGEVVAFISDEVLETLILLATTALIAYLRQQELRKEIERLNIAIDEKKRSSQVEEITDTDYFRSLLSSVKKYRKTDKSDEQDKQSEE